MATINLEKFLPKVLDQGGTGCCAEVALINVTNTMLIEAGQQPKDLSWMQLYNDTRISQGNFNKDAGTVVPIMMHVAHDIGISEAKYFANVDGNLYNKPPPAAYESAQHYKINGWNEIPLDKSQTGYQSIIAEQLREGKPVMLGLRLYGNWFFNKEGPLNSQTSEGPKDVGEFVGHEVMIYGMNDDLGVYYVRNQWGTSWGDNGNGTISYKQFNTGLHNNSLINLTTINSFGNLDVTWTKWTAQASTLYTTILNRAAEHDGLQYWAGLLQSGVSYRDASNAVMAAPEALLTARSDNLTFVETTYHNLLGRAVDPSGSAYWTDILNHGMSRGDFLNVISSYVHSDLCGINDPLAHDFAVARQTMAQLTAITYHATGEDQQALSHALDGVYNMETLEIHRVGVHDAIHTPPM